MSSEIEFADVLRTTVTSKTKKIVGQLGGVSGEGFAATDGVEWWQHVGFASRPSKAEKGKSAANAMLLRQGGIDAAFASQDVRGLEIYGNLKDGETCVYAPGEEGEGQARALFKADGSITLFTKKGNEAAGTGMMIGLDAQAGAIRMVNDKGYGIVIDQDGVKVFTKDAVLDLSSGAKLISKATTQIDGSNVVLGSVPLPGVGAILTGVTGIAGKASLKVSAE